MTEALQVEATGETVGEAKWSALRELEKLQPGIDKHGQTIDAIQYLVNAIVWRVHGEERKPIVIDAAGYRARRQASLDALAVRHAEEALSGGSPVELEPMTAVERKVVHERLKEFPGVSTQSEGTEPNRYVVIVPE